MTEEKSEAGFMIYSCFLRENKRKSGLKRNQIGSLKICGPSLFHDTLSPDYVKYVLDVSPSRLVHVITSATRQRR